MTQAIRISAGGIEIGDGLPCALIAEIGLNHNGSMELARRLIEVSAMSGATMVKFQKRNPEELADAQFLDAPFAKCPLFGKTQRAVRNRLELTYEQLKELSDYAKSFGLEFFVSVFDLTSLKVALRLETRIIKIASHSITNEPLLKAVADTGLAVFASLGASTWEEKDRAVEILSRSPLVLLHCVSSYPCPDHLAKLDTIQEIKKRYGKVAGYSGHEAGTDLTVAASVLGASIIERHITLNRAMVGLDHSLSLEPAEFASMVNQIRRIEKARGVISGILQEELAARNNYHVSVHAQHDLPEGHVLRMDDLTCKQPLQSEEKFFKGLEIGSLVGKRLRSKVSRDHAIPRDAVA